MAALLKQVFTHGARGVLHRCDFKPPASGEACVVLFDSASWRRYSGEASALLDQAERTRAARFRHARDRDTYVLAHAMWREVLGLWLGVDAAQVPLSSTPLLMASMAHTTPAAIQWGPLASIA